jgi:hypothetical protein
MARVHVVAGFDGPQVINFTSEEETARDAEEAAWAAGANDRSFAELRRERDQLLNDTDWWVLRGSITEAQTTYRQQLRNLPATVVDPANPTWPVAPGA